ncbi:Serine/threonine-protein kinase Sgk1, partial [Taenia solium]
DKQSPFIVTLSQSLRIHGAPALVLQKGSGYDLRDLIFNFGYLDENEARFYSCEIICGLEHLHSMGIVHLDVEPTNMLIADSGHLLVSDFNRSYDMTQATGPPRKTDFTGTPFFKAPEIRNRIKITTKADVYSLGVLVAAIMYGRDTVEDWLNTYRLMTGGFPNVSPPLRQFFEACLTDNHKRRLDIDGVKCLDFYKDVNWADVMACKMEPPYHPSEFRFSAGARKLALDPYDPLLLNAAYSSNMPMMDEGLLDICNKNGVRQLVVELPDHLQLAKAGLTPRRIDELFASFDFANPHYPESSHGFDEKQDVSGNETVISYSRQSLASSCSLSPTKKSI